MPLLLSWTRECYGLLLGIKYDKKHYCGVINTILRLGKVKTSQPFSMLIKAWWSSSPVWSNCKSWCCRLLLQVSQSLQNLYGAAAPAGKMRCVRRLRCAVGFGGCRQGRQPTCPMCNAVIELEVLYRLPIPWTLRHHHANADPPQPQELPPHEQVTPLQKMSCFAVLLAQQGCPMPLPRTALYEPM